MPERLSGIDRLLAERESPGAGANCFVPSTAPSCPEVPTVGVVVRTGAGYVDVVACEELNGTSIR